MRNNGCFQEEQQPFGGPVVPGIRVMSYPNAWEPKPLYQQPVATYHC